MSVFTVAAAQTVSIAGDLQANIARHLPLMRQAAEQGVTFLLFRELSLTGYERSLAAGLATAPDDSVLAPLRELASQLKLVTVVGMPIRLSVDGPVLIGALTFGADGSLQVYSKQHLHDGEEVAFSPGSSGEALTIAGESIALAVCADFSHASHPLRAAQSEANLYAVSVLIAENGYAPDTALLQGYARDHGMAVLMANPGGMTGGWQSAVRRALWAARGQRVVVAEGAGDVLVIGRRIAGQWSAEVLPVVGL